MRRISQKSAVCIIIVQVICLMILVSCTNIEEKPKDPSKQVSLEDKRVSYTKKNPPTIDGVITDIDQHIIVVEGKMGTSKSKGHISLNKNTEYLVFDGKEYKKGKQSDLQKGFRVKVWSVGEILESYPFQTTAKYVVYEKVQP
ncbi:DUF3221 domain-containing protein [Thermoflavimicrobium daqui]|uniref:DUF3221 domain-containing protein n=1 Tax=Thermoflavimicrobium daqui TaxID=2137476 RepID=A0A364K4H2_9BACL|nr:DUF3221 domain-containing protein [Thermoflavimicrobium daqui]RAL24246.1 hypothetical protein DL897_11240 [Thermoflavimicrobium daqui]